MDDKLKVSQQYWRIALRIRQLILIKKALLENGEDVTDITNTIKMLYRQTKSLEEIITNN